MLIPPSAESMTLVCSDVATSGNAMGVEIIPSALKVATRILSSWTRIFLPLTSATELIGKWP